MPLPERLAGWLAHSPLDRRVRLHDVSDPRRRRPRSPILQFHSDHPNVGNWLPVLGIHRMLGHAPDAWSVHRRPIDFAWVNRSYRAVIVGGAGLLHRVFEPFWHALEADCRLPIALWGVGGCFPDAERGLVPACPSARRLAPGLELVNVRDDVTAETFGFRDAALAPCPTLVHLVERFGIGRRRGEAVLVSSHAELVGDAESRAVEALVARRFPGARVTENQQAPRCGVDDLVRRDYLPSRLVVTTRLHGAIVAEGLGIPWIALARDEKLRAFARMWGSGRAVDDLGALERALASEAPPVRTPDLAAVRRFGARVRSWLAAYDALPAAAAAGRVVAPARPPRTASRA